MGYQETTFGSSKMLQYTDIAVILNGVQSQYQVPSAALSKPCGWKLSAVILERVTGKADSSGY